MLEQLLTTIRATILCFWDRFVTKMTQKGGIFPTGGCYFPKYVIENQRRPEDIQHVLDAQQ